MMIQTWLIDLIYDLIKYNRYGKNKISKYDSIYLIGLYGNYKNDCSKSYSRKDALIYLYGFFGEQCRFQNNSFFEEFSREKYILDRISKVNKSVCYNIDVLKEFKEETSLSTDEFSAYLYIICIYLINHYSVSQNEFKSFLENSPFPYTQLLNILNRYTIEIDGVRCSSLNRQILYTKPIIKIGNKYIATNPFLLLALFANSNYWIMRNKYLRSHSQNFVNAFGLYFEKYTEEILNNCLKEENYTKIPEDVFEKRADWKLNLGEFTLLVEQKSSLPMLEIMQNEPNITAIKKHIIKSWGEAAEQLSLTEKFLEINKTIKIILVYDEYFKSEVLEEIFSLKKNLANDGNYWLLNIREFEMLLMLYYRNKGLFTTVMNEKIEAETSFSKNGRELIFFIEKHKITNIDYLEEFKIKDEFNKIKDFIYMSFK